MYSNPNLWFTLWDLSGLGQLLPSSFRKLQYVTFLIHPTLWCMQSFIQIGQGVLTIRLYTLFNLHQRFTKWSLNIKQWLTRSFSIICRSLSTWYQYLGDLHQRESLHFTLESLPAKTFKQTLKVCSSSNIFSKCHFYPHFPIDLLISVEITVPENGHNRWCLLKGNVI